MTTQFPNLKAANAPHTYQFAHLLRMPSDPVVNQIVPFENLTQEVRQFLAFQVNPRTRDSAARTLVIQGRPGEGKSDGALVAVLNANANFVVAVISASMFASETEGGASDLVDQVMAEFARWSLDHQRRVVVIINDIDMSIMSGDDHTSSTSNKGLLLEKFHYLADNRHLYRNFDGSNIAFMVTMNDGSNMRDSLYRPGRAVTYTHEPTTDDKANIAWKILDPRTGDERILVAKLVRKYAHRQPVAFWRALSDAMQGAHAKRAIAHGIDGIATNAALNRRVPLTADVAWACAKHIRASRIRVFLTRRGLFGRR